MSAHLARGPLASPVGQWIVLGMGVVAASGKENVNSFFQTAARTALQLAGDFDGAARIGLPGGGGGGGTQQQPIVIHTSQSNSPSDTRHYFASVVQITVGAGACWVGYVIMSSFLPEAVKELLPVTRRFFELAVSTLGNSIIAVRDALSDRMDGLSAKQDELGAKQDETHAEVLAVRGDVGDVRSELDSIHASVLRCEGSLSESERGQARTARGVGLLVRCVRALLPGNATLASELDRFSQEMEEIERARPGGVASDAVIPNKNVNASGRDVGPQRRPISRQTSAEFAAGGGMGGGGDAGCNPQQQTPGGPSRGYLRMDSLPEGATEVEEQSSVAGVGANNLADMQGLMNMLGRSGSFSIRAA